LTLKPGGFYFLEEIYPTLYQNFLTRRILVHPHCDRFDGSDLRLTKAIRGKHNFMPVHYPWRSF
jgi:hypothetical protein